MLWLGNRSKEETLDQIVRGEEPVDERVVELLERGVDAIFCGNDATAEGALESIRAGGLSVPGDVALAGFDDVGFAAELDPPLATIRQGEQEQGAETARASSTCCGIGEADRAGSSCRPSW